MTNPEILVLDEPGTGLDVLAREQLLQRVKEIAETTDSTIIYVTHYPEEIQDCFSKCLLMQNGKVLANGEVKDIFNSEGLSRLLQCEVSVQKNTQGTISLKRQK